MNPHLQDSLQQHLAHIVRERDPFLASAGHFYVKEYLYQELSQWGRVERQAFQTLKKMPKSIHENLILKLPGSRQLPSIVLGAHFDAVPGSPGADDNATGLAVLLELARHFYQYPARHPLHLVAFDLEEYGRLGSQAYVQDLQYHHTKITTMISLEMLGYMDPNPHTQTYPGKLSYFYPHTGNFIALLGNFSSIPTMLTLSHHLKQQGAACEWLPIPFKGNWLPDTRRSDHSPFWDAGYPALMITDTANMRNPHYHQTSDIIETLNIEFLGAVCNGLVRSIQKL